MKSTQSIGGAGGVGTRPTRLQRELAAARRALARPSSPIDDTLDAVVGRLLAEVTTAPVAEDPAPVEVEVRQRRHAPHH